MFEPQTTRTTRTRALQTSHCPTCQKYAERMRSLKESALPLLIKVEANDFDLRDMAQLIELLAQLGDLMDEMIEYPPQLADVSNSAQVAETVSRLL